MVSSASELPTTTALSRRGPRLRRFILSLSRTLKPCRSPRIAPTEFGRWLPAPAWIGASAWAGFGPNFVLDGAPAGASPDASILAYMYISWQGVVRAAKALCLAPAGLGGGDDPGAGTARMSHGTCAVGERRERESPVSNGVRELDGMATLAIVFPLLPGKSDDGRSFAQELMSSRA